MPNGSQSVPCQSSGNFSLTVGRLSSLQFGLAALPLLCETLQRLSRLLQLLLDLLWPVVVIGAFTGWAGCLVTGLLQTFQHSPLGVDLHLVSVGRLFGALQGLRQLLKFSQTFRERLFCSGQSTLAGGNRNLAQLTGLLHAPLSSCHPLILECQLSLQLAKAGEDLGSVLGQLRDAIQLLRGLSKPGFSTLSLGDEKGQRLLLSLDARLQLGAAAANILLPVQLSLQILAARRDLVTLADQGVEAEPGRLRLLAGRQLLVRQGSHTLFQFCAFGGDLCRVFQEPLFQC